MQFQVLGQARALVDAAPGSPREVDLGARKPRAVLAALAMTPGRPVPADTVVDLVWGGEPPRAAHGALHAYLSGLRKALEPGRSAWGAGAVIETTDHGYVLRAEPRDVDTHLFAEEASTCERRLAPLAGQLTDGVTSGWPNRGDVLGLVDRLDAALATWRGTPYADLPDHPTVTAERAALGQVRAAAEEARLLGLLALGDPASVLAATEPAVGQGELRERVWALHALALTRSGRQADALEALREVRTLLLDELGLDPGAELRGLEQAVLQQADWLHAALPVAGARRPGPARPDAATEPRTTRPEVSRPAVTRAAVGRVAELDRLRILADDVRAGHHAVVQVVGEPGIGKSWLAASAVAQAREAGVRVGVGRCSPDDGAPPLWPWRSALADLGAAVEESTVAVADAAGAAGPADAAGAADDADAAGAAEQRAFRVADQVRAAVLAAATGPTLLVLEDLHWADEASLRALAHVVDTLPDDVPVALLVTRRPHPEPHGSGLLAEALARRHAGRIDLAGLDATEATTLVREVAAEEVPEAVALRWHERSGGNPYFLVELARLGPQEDGDELPGTVRDVVARRLVSLPERVLQTLRTAAVVGRRFHLLTVAAAVDTGPDRVDPDDLLDAVAADVEVAVAAGLVRETGVEEFAFAHALTRDTVAGTLTSTRAARRHARVAHALEHDPEVAALHTREQLVAERARHWLSAGASHVGRAWVAAREAAEQARRLTAYAEAMRLRRAAVEAHRRVPDADLDTRFDLLLELAGDAGYAAVWPQVEEAAFEAMALGRRLDAPQRVARAAAVLTAYCVWTPHELDVVFEDGVDDLRWALAATPPDAWATRAQLQLALAVELYYEPATRAERRALVESGMAAAHRSGDPAVLSWAAATAWLASWSPDQREVREALTRTAADALAQRPDPAAEAVLLLRRAIEAVERADRAVFDASIDAAEAQARRLRLHYVTLTVVWLRLSLAALRRQPEAAAAAHAELAVLAPQVAIPMQDAQAPAAAVATVLWDRSALAATLPMLEQAQREVGGMAVLVHLASARAGEVADLRAWLRESPVPVEEDLYWSTVSDWAMESEAALVAGDEVVARHALDVLEPYGGGLVLAGAVLVLGPVDGYVALARRALGDVVGASLAADAADQLARAWDLPAYVTWLAGLRERFGF